MRVGPVEGTVLFVDGSGFEDTGEELVCDADAGVGFSVFQQYIIAWIVLLDKGIFQQQSIFFSIDNRIADIPYLGH
jgi:hypothetical protein